MLTGKELGEAIGSAISKKGVKPADVARHFGIKPPSVNGWVATGRIGKDKLSSLFEYFSDVAGPEHWGMSTPMPTTAPTLPANIPRLTPPPDPLLAELLAHAGRMSRAGLARLVERAASLAEQYPAQANPAKSSG